MEPQDIFRHTAYGRGVADIRQISIADGPGAGGRLIEVRTPSTLAADIALDRGGDILRLSFQGRQIGWHSATEAPNPRPDMEAEHGLRFLRGFDGFIVTCGLDHHGLPTETSAADARYPHRKRHVHPLHGRIAGARASITQQRIDWRAHELVVTLCARQAAVFGEVLELKRRYTFSLSEPTVRMVDTVTNRGFRPARHGILYHINLGYPFLDPNARLVGEDWVLRDRLDDGSATPSDDHVELVDIGPSPASGAIGMMSGSGTGLRITTDPDQLPATALWRAFQSGIYAVGLEPQTDFEDRASAMVPAGEERTYDLKITLYTQ